MGDPKVPRLVWQINNSRLVALPVVVASLIGGVMLLSLARETNNMVVVVNWNKSGKRIDLIQVQSETWKWSDTIHAETNGRFSIGRVPHYWEHGDIDVNVHLRGPSDESVVSKTIRAVGRNGNTLCIELHDESNITVDWNRLAGQGGTMKQ